MGLLTFFQSRRKPHLMPLPGGSFTLDPEGRIMTSTVPRSYPVATVKEIGDTVLEIFRAAKQAQLPLREFTVHYAALKVLARELRGGAIVYLTPQATPAVAKVSN